MNRSRRGAILIEQDPPWLHRVERVLTVWLLALVVFGIFLTWRWPLVNDAALQHYITFLTDSGFAPFREIADMNLPGSLMVDWTVVHLLGPGPVAWRIFDALLLLLAGVAMHSIARPLNRMTGVIAASLFSLLHLRDGMGQAGQRDLMEAVLLLGLLAATLHSRRSSALWPLALAGLCAASAITIKPDSLLLSAPLLFFAVFRSPRRGRSFLIAPLALLLPLLASIAYLAHFHALHAFWLSLSEITPYYARLGRQGFGELLRDCLSTPMRILLAVAVLLALLDRARWTQAHTLLSLATIWGLFSFFLQGKGYPYHRYPTLAFLLLWASIACTGTLRSSATVPRLLGVAGLLYAALVVAPVSLTRAAHAAWNDSLLLALQADLTRLGGDHLAHDVQCVDSISGCNIVLYRMRLPEETGMLSDFLLFGPATEPAVLHARASFSRQISAKPPHVIVITGWLHPSGLDHFGKLALWPAFAAFLDQHYTLAVQRDFAPGQNGPLSYRIYTLR